MKSEILLDDGDTLTPIITRRYWLSIVLVLVIVFCWWQYYEAKSLPYDLNYGTILLSLLTSIVTFVILILVYWKKRHLIVDNIWAVLLYLIFSSPLSLIIVVYHYSFFFGANLAIG
jgi:hypothetical protein